MRRRQGQRRSWSRSTTKLQNGQVVRIITSKTASGPSRDWLHAQSLGYVTTASAREKIRQWFRRQERDENIAQGKEILERELRRLGVEVKLDDVAQALPAVHQVDDFLAADRLRRDLAAGDRRHAWSRPRAEELAAQPADTHRRRAAGHRAAGAWASAIC